MDEQSPLKPSGEPSEAVQPKPSFWKRQVNETPTVPQKVFDVIVGAILPVVLFAFDPVLFKDMGCAGYAVPYSAFAYFAVAFGVISLLVWLFAPVRTGIAPAVFAGVFYTGEVFALIIGIILLPISIFGLVLIYGVLGFLPFLVAYVYYRNAVRAHRLAKSMGIEQRRLAGFMLAGVVAVLGIPGLIHLRATETIRQSTDKIAHRQNPGDVVTAINELKTTHLVCLGLCGPKIGAALMTFNDRELTFTERNAMVEQATGAPPSSTCISNTQYVD